MTVELRRTTNADPAWSQLVVGLDADLRDRYGAIQDQYAPLNVLTTDTAIVAFVDGAPAGIGCFKPFDAEARTIELKRVFVDPSARGRGVGRAIVDGLEAWARELGFTTAVLETGNLQHEAIAMYEALGYERTPLFPPYVGMPASICMRKLL